MILVGDVGGTKTRLALCEAASEGGATAREEVFASAGFDSLEEILQRFLGRAPSRPLRAACFAVAGPVIEGCAKITNLPWELDERRLRELLRVEVRLINDLEAAAHGLPAIGPAEVEVLQSGVRRRANVALIAAGTGLGEAILIRAGDRDWVIATEGGHADFAPRSDLEMALLNYLRAAFGHVSYERLLSGPGLHNIYRFLRDTGHVPEAPWVGERLARADDPSAAISEIALAGQDRLCAATLELFVSIYGAEAGNLALKALALGGVFVGGGIAPKILPRLRNGSFVRAFSDKGRMSGLLRSIEVSVILNPRLALIGAARMAEALRRDAAERAAGDTGGSRSA